MADRRPTPLKSHEYHLIAAGFVYTRVEPALHCTGGTYSCRSITSTESEPINEPVDPVEPDASGLSIDQDLDVVRTAVSAKTAVVVHGMGSQKPRVETVNGFIQTALKPFRGGRIYYLRPDEISGSYEARRLLAIERKQGGTVVQTQTEFFENHLSKMTFGNQFQDLLPERQHLLRQGFFLDARQSQWLSKSRRSAACRRSTCPAMWSFAAGCLSGVITRLPTRTMLDQKAYPDQSDACTPFHLVRAEWPAEPSRPDSASCAYAPETATRSRTLSWVKAFQTSYAVRVPSPVPRRPARVRRHRFDGSRGGPAMRGAACLALPGLIHSMTRETLRGSLRHSQRRRAISLRPSQHPHAPREHLALERVGKEREHVCTASNR